jgi:hypothetical protein
LEEKLKSEGKCLFCNETFAKAGIMRHLKMHLAQIAKTGKKGNSYLVKVDNDPRWNGLPYFLYLWINGNAKMEDFDAFLREIWLECCGHMSKFTDKSFKREMSMGSYDIMDAFDFLEQGKVKQYEKIMEDFGEIPMSRAINKVFAKGKKYEYEYDYGSSTILQIEVMEEYPFAAPKKMVLLSRNEPLEIRCDMCHTEIAEVACTVHIYEEEGKFCSKCAKKHAKVCSDFADYASATIVNSPRMGVCGYEGGVIDIERDGIFNKK